jgi:hypothetical protein
VLQVKVHALLAHTACPFGTPLHALPHVLQFLGSLDVSAHVPPHKVEADVGQPVEHA